jgi:hypothetical protein
MKSDVPLVRSILIFYWEANFVSQRNALFNVKDNFWEMNDLNPTDPVRNPAVTVLVRDDGTGVQQ